MTVGHRSPILGYNHNLGYRGLVFHVQTEDSGVNNPHVFTHLFNGGVIITTRKLEYDADAAADVVKSLMQAQHKRILKGLLKGEYDDKIDAYLGSNPDLLPRGSTAKPGDAATPGDATIEMSGEQVRLSGKQSGGSGGNDGPGPDDGPHDSVDDTIPIGDDELPPSLSADSVLPPPLPTGKQAAPASAPSGSIPTMKPANRPPRRFPRPGTASRTRITPTIPPVDSPHSKTVPRIRASGKVLVSSPPIVVKSGGPQAQPAKKPPARTVRDSSDSIFDQNLITEKSLDEVILAYLSEDAED